MSFSVGEGEIVALLGRNGSGRSTTVKAIMGLVHTEGSVDWRGQQLVGRKAFEIAHAGIGYVPENRDIFPTLTVHQNLMLGQKRGAEAPRWSFDDMYALFPRLKERQHTEAGVLSGGEQQMLTLCRTLMGDPDLIMIDEPTEGLAPKIIEQVPAGAEGARHRRPAGGAEADHRAGGRRPLPRHGARPDRVRRHIRRSPPRCGRPQGVAGSLMRGALPRAERCSSSQR